MIKHLSVKNYALIESLNIDFDDGISIITGETGAGKSILLGALSLVLGQRADTSVLFDKEKKCFVEAHFMVSKYNMQLFFEENELDYEILTIVRREIMPNNRSRAFINDTPVNNSLLKDFAANLIDIHSQHDTLSLMRADYQMAVLDDFAENAKNLEQYRLLHSSYVKNNKRLELLLQEESKSKSDFDYYSYLYNELQAANISENEQGEAENELELLNNTENIKRRLNAALDILNLNENNLLTGLKDVNNLLEGLQKFMPELQDLFQRTSSVYIELKDVCAEIERAEARVSYSKERIDEINERLSILYELQKKHRVNTCKELSDIAESISEKLLVIGSLDNDIESLRNKIKEEEKALRLLAETISDKRIKTIPVLCERIGFLLKELAMPDARIHIDIKRQLPFRSDGTDSLVFLFSANKGSAPEEISKVASGGELSRLMLAVKSVVSHKKLLPTLIFDEIDTGISGETAVKTASIINRMGKNMQIVAITHLPQIACLGKSHYVVYKTEKNAKTVSGISKLHADERIKAIAQMISGHKISDASLQTAKELVAKFN